jgi:hypothetical protein
MCSVSKHWVNFYGPQHMDEKHEDHYIDSKAASWTYKALHRWLYARTMPDKDTLREWMGDVPADWLQGSETERLNCSVAVHLYLWACERSWDGLADMMVTFLFQQYQRQQFPPSLERVRQLFSDGVDRAGRLLEDLFLDLYLLFGVPSYYTRRSYTKTRVNTEMQKWPQKFIFRFFEQSWKLTDDEKEGLELVNYHKHGRGGDIETYPTCKTSELRAKLTML